MTILRRYLTAHLTRITFLALFALVALLSFFSLIDELGEAGSGNYGVPQILLYILLTMPKLVYDLFPVAAVIGSMTALGIMAKNSELDVIRVSGVSRARLALLLARSGLFLVFIAVVIGEFVAPVSEETAQKMRSVAMTEQITLETQHGLWVRDGNSFVNIKKVLPGDRLREIYIYEFDDNNRLRSSISAESAEYRDNRWVLKDIRQSLISDGGVKSKVIQRAAWGSMIDPQMIDLIIVKPQYLTFWGLTNYIRYLGENEQNTRVYEQALWTKLVKPFSILAMIILAVPLVRAHSSFIAVGQQVFLGAAIGIVFHLCNDISAHLGIVYEIPAWISVTTPTVLLYGVILYLIRN